MIEIFFWPSINGSKVVVFCEAAGLAYRVRPVNIEAGEQFDDAFLALSPANKVPAIVHHREDGERVALFESAAILLYLAETFDCLRGGAGDRVQVLQWLIFASASMGPYLGQAYHFRNNAPDRHAYAIERYSREAARLAQIVDRRLDRHEFLGCDRFSIADIAAYPWLARWQKLGIDAEALPNLRRWLGVVAALPAVERGMAVLAEMQRTGPMSAETWEIYYGESQRRQRLG